MAPDKQSRPGGGAGKNETRSTMNETTRLAGYTEHSHIHQKQDRCRPVSFSTTRTQPESETDIAGERKRADSVNKGGTAFFRHKRKKVSPLQQSTNSVWPVFLNTMWCFEKLFLRRTDAKFSKRQFNKVFSAFVPFHSFSLPKEPLESTGWRIRLRGPQ